MGIITAWILILWYCTVSLFAQPNSSLTSSTSTSFQSPHTAEMLIDANADTKNHITLTGIPWTYYAGDIAGTAWTQAQFQDSTWGRLSVSFGERLSDSVWHGIGCFRVRVRVAPNLRNTALVLRVRQLASAMEIYWDGKLLYSFGRANADPRIEIPAIINGEAVPLYCDSREEHLLAIRYSSHLRYDDKPTGFRLRVAKMRWEEYIEMYNQVSILQESSIIITFTIALVLCALHILMFFAYRNNTLHLWIAVLWGFLSVSQGLSICDRYLGARYFQASFCFIVSDVMLVLGYQFSLFVLYRICYGRIPFVALPISLIFAANIVHRVLPVHWRVVSWNWSLIPVAVVLAVESARVIWHFGNRISNIKILGLGLICSFIGYVGSTFFYDYLFVILNTYTPGRLLQQFTIIAYPASFTVYAAWEFTRRERLLARQNAELEAEVESGTAELRAANVEIQTVNQALHDLNHDLQASNEELDAANHFKIQMLSVAAHDLRNPLGVVMNYADMLAENVPPSSMDARMLQGIQRSTDKMLRLIKDLLDTSALELGKIELETIYFDWGLQIVNVCESYYTAAEQKQQTLDFARVQNHVIQADEERLWQVADNLISNAVKYSRLGGTIAVALEQVGACICFRVQDSGPGLTDDDKTKLFGHFQRLSATPTGGESSTGVGLSIVKKIVELHNGRIWVESVVGQGSTFVVELPMYTNRNT